jgi:hypothetical protein
VPTKCPDRREACVSLLLKRYRTAGEAAAVRARSLFIRIIESVAQAHDRLREIVRCDTGRRRRRNRVPIGENLPSTALKRPIGQRLPR